jgi:magnesium-transporting ATPase (P-type)
LQDKRAIRKWAQQVLRDICKSKSLEPTIRTFANNEKRDGKGLHDLIAETYNKLKHADEEQDDVEVLEDDLRVLVVLAVTDLLRLNLPHTDSIKSILEFQKSLN